MVTADTQRPITDHAPRCRACGKTLVVVASRPWVIDCYRRMKGPDGRSRRCQFRNLDPDHYDESTR